LRAQSGAGETRADLRAGRSLGRSNPLDGQITGGFDRFQLVSAHQKPSLSPLRRGPVLGEAPTSVRERELAQLRRSVQAQAPLPPVTLGAPKHR
jgi:hypothetical protein